MDWHREQKIDHCQEVAGLMREMEQMCEFTRELQNKIATSVVVSTDAFDVFGVASVQEDQNDVVLGGFEDTVQD